MYINLADIDSNVSMSIVRDLKRRIETQVSFCYGRFQDWNMLFRGKEIRVGHTDQINFR
jgi:hypothetical protein